MSKQWLNSSWSRPLLAGSALILLVGGCAHSSQSPAGSAGGSAGGPGSMPAPAKNPVQSSTRFDNLDLRRATISKDEQGNLIAKLGIGVDVVGTLCVDSQSQLTYEQHPVVFRNPPPRQPLSPEDRASLATSLQRTLNAPGQTVDPLWQQILTAAQK